MKKVFSNELSQAILKEFPSVIAVPFADLEEELNKVNFSSQIIFNRMIDLFEISMTTVSLISVATILHEDQSFPPQFKRIIKELKDNPKLSTGFWWECLRESLKTSLELECEGVTRELALKYFNKKGKPTKLAQKLNMIPALRNKAKGHSWTLPEDTYLSYNEEYLPILGMWLSALSCLQNYLILSPFSVYPNEESSTWCAYILHGNIIKPYSKNMNTKAALQLNDLYIVPKRITQELESEDFQFVSLSPLFILRKTAGIIPEVFLYQGGNSKKAVYSGSFSAEKLEETSFIEKVRSFLTVSDNESPFSGGVERLLGPFRHAAQVETRQWLDRMLSQHIYDPEICVERQIAKQHLQTFFESEQRGTFILGQSGTGKTNFIADLANQWSVNGHPQEICVVISAETLFSRANEIETWLSAHLCGGLSFVEWVTQLNKLLQVKEQLTCLIIIEGIDRHSNPILLLNHYINLVKKLEFAKYLKLIATSTLMLLKTFHQNHGPLDKRLFYSSSFGLATDLPQDEQGISLGLLTPNELQQAFIAYRDSSSYQSILTLYHELTPKMQATLAHPLILRIAMTIYQGGKLPKEIFGLDMLQEYTAKRVFISIERLDFIAEFIDELILQKKRKLAFDEARKNHILRQVLISNSPSAPYKQLSEDLVLSVRAHSYPNDLPFPQTFTIEFTFDRVLDYLIFWRISTRHDLNETNSSLGSFLKISSDFTNLRSALYLWGIHLVRINQLDEILSLYLFENKNLSNQFIKELIVHVIEVIDFSTEQSPLVNLVIKLYEKDYHRTAKLMNEVIVNRFEQGDWSIARQLILTLDYVTESKQQEIINLNRLVMLEKNLDLWKKALEHSDQCFTFFTQNTPSWLKSTTYTNRASVLYDLGPRDQVLPCLEQAELFAEEQTFLLAAILNNRAIYYLYHGQCEKAVEILDKALHLPKLQDTQKAYLESNLGLSYLSLALTDSDLIMQATTRLTSAKSLFKNLGHLQGLIYAICNLGLAYLAQELFEEAELAFKQTRQLAFQLDEDWPAYGSLTNSACVELLSPQGDLQKAYNLAYESYQSSLQNDDPKGIAEASLIAAQAALRQSHEKPDQQKVAIELFTISADFFTQLDQRLGLSCAQVGLLQLDPSLNLDPRETLKNTSFEKLEPDLYVLPWHMLLLMEIF